MTRRDFLGSAAGMGCGALFGRDLRNTQLAHPETEFPLIAPGSLSAWESRKAHLREQVLCAAGLLPAPRRPEMPVRLRKRVFHRGFITEAMLLETVPGYFVGATLYRPVWQTRRSPGVLIPHGHWKHGRVEDLPEYSVPALAANLALQGYVALTWDMVGYNDTRQTNHDFGGKAEALWGFTPLGLQLWNSVRALDYLISRPDVDPARIGCTGASGGGTQTILLTAVDPRITCSAPVNMISASYQGADPCEEAPNLRLGTNNVEIAALMAPSPMLVVSCTQDWTQHTPEREFPYLQSVYRLYGREPAVANAHFDAPHNYNRHSREAVYAFFATHLLDRPDLRPHDKDAGPFRAEDLLAEYAAPGDYNQVFAAWKAMPLDTSREGVRLAMRAALGCEWPESVHHSRAGDITTLYCPECGQEVPGRWRVGEGDPIVVVHPRGSAFGMEAFTGSEARPVFFADVFQTGRARGHRERGGRWYLSYNQTDDAHRVQDILTAVAWTRQQTGRTPTLVGLETAAVWSIFAAAVCPDRVELKAELNGWKGTDADFVRDFFVPGVRRTGGLQAAMQLAGK